MHTKIKHKATEDEKLIAVIFECLFEWLTYLSWFNKNQVRTIVRIHSKKFGSNSYSNSNKHCWNDHTWLKPVSPYFSIRVPQSRSCQEILLNSLQVWDRLWRLFPKWVPWPSGSSLPWQLNSLGHPRSVIMDRPSDTSWSEFTQPNHRNQRRVAW